MSKNELIAKIEYELKKLDSADSFGLWDTAVYVLSDDENTALIGANSIRSIVIGDDSGKAESTTRADAAKLLYAYLNI